MIPRNIVLENAELIFGLVKKHLLTEYPDHRIDEALTSVRRKIQNRQFQLSDKYFSTLESVFDNVDVFTPVIINDIPVLQAFTMMVYSSYLKYDITSKMQEKHIFYKDIKSLSEFLLEDNRGVKQIQIKSEKNIDGKSKLVTIQSNEILQLMVNSIKTTLQQDDIRTYLEYSNNEGFDDTLHGILKSFCKSSQKKEPERMFVKKNASLMLREYFIYKNLLGMAENINITDDAAIIIGRILNQINMLPASEDKYANDKYLSRVYTTYAAYLLRIVKNYISAGLKN